MAERRRVSRGSRALGLASLGLALVAGAVPGGVAVAAWRGVALPAFLSASPGPIAAGVAGIALLVAVAGALVGRRGVSASVVVGALLAVGVLAGVVVVALTGQS